MTDRVLVIHLKTLLEILDKEADIRCWRVWRVRQAHLDILSLGLSWDFDPRNLEVESLSFRAEQILVTLLFFSYSQELLEGFHPSHYL